MGQGRPCNYRLRPSAPGTEIAACQAAFANQKHVGLTAAINRSAPVHERMAAIKEPVGSIG